MRFVIILLILFQSFSIQARLFKTFSSNYSERKLTELTYQTNKQAYNFKRAVSILKKNFPQPLDTRYVDVQRKRLSKVFHPKIFLHPDYVDMRFKGKKFARFSEFDFLGNSVKINKQEVHIKAGKSLIRLHQGLLKIIGAKENTQQSMMVLFVVIPWMTEAKVQSFEGDLIVVKNIICKEPSYRIEEKFQIISSFIRSIEAFMKKPIHKKSCGLWANKTMQGLTELFSDQSLIYICEKAKLALNCIDNATNFTYDPQTIEPKKEK